MEREEHKSFGGLRFAGFVPFTFYGGQWWLLLGREADGWGVFGGSPETSDLSPAHAAVREAREESHGLLLEPALWKGCRRGPLLLTPRAKIYGVPVPWRLKRQMNKTLLPQAQLLPTQGCFEKKEVKWFPLDLFCSSPRAKTVAGKKLRAPLPFSKEVTCSLIVGWADFNESFWRTSRLRRSAMAMDRACFLETGVRAETRSESPMSARRSPSARRRSGQRKFRRQSAQYVQSRSL